MSRKKIKLNVKFNKDKVRCAKSPEECKNCIEASSCEMIDMYYYPYEGVRECMKHSSYQRDRGAMKQRRH